MTVLFVEQDVKFTWQSCLGNENWIIILKSCAKMKKKLQSGWNGLKVRHDIKSLKN